jgi:hypothetical protein
MRGGTDDPSTLKQSLQQRAPEGACKVMLAFRPVQARFGDHHRWIDAFAEQAAARESFRAPLGQCGHGIDGMQEFLPRQRSRNADSETAGHVAVASARFSQWVARPGPAVCGTSRAAVRYRPEHFDRLRDFVIRNAVQTHPALLPRGNELQ